MRKYAEKHWAPTLVGYIGDPKNNYFPYTEQELEDEITKMANTLSEVRDFSALATAGFNKIEAISTDTGKASEAYVKFLEHLNEEIMLALFGSMGQRSSSGSFYATSSVLDESWLRFITGVRRQYEFVLKRFYTKVLLPQNGIFGVEDDDIVFEWSILHTESRLETVKAIVELAKVGTFNDRQEMRDAVAEVMPLLDDTDAKGEGWVPETAKKPEPTAGGMVRNPKQTTDKRPPTIQRKAQVKEDSDSSWPGSE